MDLGFFLRLSVGLAGALREVHRRAIVHKNVKPAHVLVNAGTGLIVDCYTDAFFSDLLG
jgi:hypothetical protein